MRLHGTFLKAAAVIALAASGLTYAVGQVSSAQISGSIIDPSGSAVSGAQVILTNTANSKSRTVSSNSEGFYNAPSLSPGTYDVQVTAAGFETEVRKDVVLGVGVRQSLNFNLQVGRVQAQVVVMETAPQIDLTSSSLSGQVNGTSVRQLPLNGRSWTDLAALTPGVTVIQTQAPVTASDRPKRGLGAELSIAGGRPQQNSYLLDGININDYSNAGPGSVLGGNLGVDAIQEFTVVTVNPTANYGRTAGGVISAITRSGTNAFHGSAYEFVRDSALDAKNYFDSAQKPPFRRNQFGGSFGGPIRKSKTFFFADYEGVRQNLGTTILDTVPSPAARLGNLCTIPDGTCTPTTVAADPAASRFISAFYPLPNGAVLGNGDTGIFTFSGAQITTENYLIGRIDHTFSDKDSLAGTYMYDNSPSQQNDEFNNKTIVSKTVRQVFSLLETHIFNQALLNSVHVGFNRDNAGSPFSVVAKTKNASDTSFGFVPGDTAGGVQVPGLTTFSGGLSAANPLLFRWNSFQAYDDVTLTKGINSFTMGAAIEHIQDNQFSADTPGGFYTFNSLSDLVTNNPATLIATLPGSITPRHLRQNIFGAYFQDDLRLRPNFTLTLGMRYEIASIPKETQGKLSNLRVLAGSQPFTGSPYIKNPTFKNFEPHLGFAWDPFGNGKTSIRGGYGIYDVLPYIVEMGSGVDASFPFAQNVSGFTLPQGSFPNLAFQTIANNPSDHRVYVLQFNPPRNYVQQWNLNVQRQLFSNTTALIAYVGSHGVHMWYQTDDANIVLPVKHTAEGYFWPTPVGSGTVVDPAVGRVLLANWSSGEHYNGLQAALSQRMSHGVQAQVSFTWSKCIDNSSGSAASDQYRNSLAATLYTDPKAHVGLCDTNVGKNLVASTIWDVPHPRTLSGVGGWAASGWQAGGIITAATGQPFSVVIGGDPLGLNSVVPFDYPDRVRGPGCGSAINPGKPNNYIKLNCFSFPNPSNRLGNSGRNSLIGPGIVNFDFSLFKNNPLKWISESANLQFRAEIFNLLNHPNFAPPTNNNTLFDSSGNPVPGAGLIDQTTLTSREIQLALKFTF